MQTARRSLAVLALTALAAVPGITAATAATTPVPGPVLITKRPIIQPVAPFTIAGRVTAVDPIHRTIRITTSPRGPLRPLVRAVPAPIGSIHVAAAARITVNRAN